MKNLLFAIAMLLCSTIYAQKEVAKNSLFIRVYNLEGDKMNKGKVLSVNDTILQLQEKNGSVDIDIRTIGFIKTKHSAGNNMLFGSLIGLTVGVIFGVATSDPNPDEVFFGYSASEGGTGFGLIGAILGTGVGGTTALFKNSKSYIINGDTSKWKVFEKMISGKKN
ncbi:hypothetical protein [Flavobacterium soyangense]|uniref:Glycine zipper family protein n=1 Tax=Flavobacterium soyangense TaxID=2023265 RepID=A0A930Y0H4_9FLAO|nr:hypothetical protein [Flavobacterium soyangense]MBF2708469.1 hypothetical protein [Flavobacterium soyangense]